MVHGLEKFKEYFGEYTNQYVFIGGTACDILLDELGAPFRVTNDIDIVLIIEVLEPSFGETFWNFIEDGGYKHRNKGTAINQFYRFTDPTDPTFPKMIELFSKNPSNFDLEFDTGLTPIHIDESIVSLSAILLNDAYYDLLISGKQIIDGYSLIGIETMILFKINAWLDMNNRKENGEQIDSKNIKKHKNDIFRLLANVKPTSKMKTPDLIQKDITQFIVQIQYDKPDLKNLGIRGISLDGILTILSDVFLENPKTK